MVRTVQRPSRITNENARAEPTTPSRRNSKAVACLGASILGERSWNIELTVSQYGEGDQKYKRTEGRPSRTDDDSLQGLGDGLLASQSLLQKGKRIQNTQAAVRMDNASAPLTDSVRFSGNTATPGSQMPTPPGSSQSSHDSSLADASPAVRPPPLSPSPIKSRPAIGAKRSRGTGAFVGSPALARMSESAQQQASPNPRVRKAGRQSFLEDSTRSGSARPEIFMLLSETGMQEGQPQARSAQAETPAKTKPSRSRTNASPTRRRKSNARWNAGESQGSDSESDLGTEDLTEESFIREVQERRWNPDRMTPDFPVRTRLVWPETDARALTKRGGAQGGATATATEPSGSSATPAGRPASSGSGRKGEVSAIANPASSSKSKGVHRAQQSSAVTSNDAGHGVSRTQRPKSKGKSSTRGTRPRRSTIGNSSRAPAPAAEPALSQEPATPASPSDDPLLLRAATDDEYIDEDADESYIPGKGKGRSGSVKGWVDEGVGPDAEDAPGALGLAHTHFAADTTALNRQEKDLLPPDVRQAWHENWTPYRLRTSSPASGTATAHQSATESPAAPGTSIRRSESPEADAPFFDASAQNQSEDDESDENGGQSSAVYAEVNAIDPARSTFEDDRPNLGSGSLEANTHESGAEAEERAASNSSNDSSRKQADIGDTAGDEDAEYNGDATWNSGWGDGGPGGSAGEVSKDMLSIAGGERPDADSSGEDHEPEGQPEYFSENQAADNLFEGQEAEQYQWGDEHHGFSDSGGEESEPVFLHSGYNPEQDARLDRSDDDSETSDDEGGGEVETDEPDVEEQEQQEDEEKEDDGRSDEDEREQKRWDEEGSQLSDDEDNEATEYAHEEESTAAVLDAHLHRHGLQPESPRRMSPNKSSTGRNISTDLNAAHASNNIVRDDAWVDLSVQAAGSQRASGSGLGLGLRSWQMDDAEDMSRSLSAITHRRALMLAQDAPTPVVEVCSLDPEAAARAAAILKLVSRRL